ncbi:hypothetical protein [Spirosoma pollinicola]|uniref:Uncharacterized protein n=1 Tax=Spirosoma pollinicola TaxID=2057025 RepID=A0A2K8Z2F9_9BACT|nr:hypothetical protein [Spirosoma pollinicola]AUD04019.1 hypothetical protein CWM47_20625 [Spirosoma pollinicola]
MNRLPTSPNVLDNTLRLMAFTASDSEIDRLADWVFSAPIHLEPNPQREQQLLGMFTQLPSPTLGSVLQQAIQQQAIELPQLVSQTRFPEGLLTKLLVDALFISNVPVVLLKNLLLRLQIPFSVAQSAIEQTLQQLRMAATQEANQSAGSLAFRRENGEARSAESRQEGRSLFENDEAVAMYLHRLENLMASA